MHLLNKEYTDNGEHSGDNNIGEDKWMDYSIKHEGQLSWGIFTNKITDICNCVTTQPATHTVLKFQETNSSHW